jgi:hypothetical protein
LLDSWRRTTPPNSTSASFPSTPIPRSGNAVAVMPQAAPGMQMYELHFAYVFKMRLLFKLPFSYLQRSQLLLGPKPFGVDRMLAIFYNIIDEEDVDSSVDIYLQVDHSKIHCLRK